MSVGDGSGVDDVLGALETRDLKAEYIRLFSLAITDVVDEILDKVKGGNTKELQTIINEAAMKCWDISNADFQDNYNPFHGRES